jgi:hypothetical protein
MIYVRGMKKFLSLFFFSIVVNAFFAQSNLEQSYDRNEIRPEQHKPIDVTRQQQLREQTQWKLYRQAHTGWMVHFNELTQTPHRAYGPGIAQNEQAWLEEVRQLFGLQGELDFQGVFKQGDRTTYRWKQRIDGLSVLFSDVHCVVYNDKIVSWNWDVYSTEESTGLSVKSDSDLHQSAIANLDYVIDEVILEGMMYFPLHKQGKLDLKKVQSFVVKTHNEVQIPQRYKVYVDAVTGELLYRVNEIVHVCPDKGCTHQSNLPFVVSAQVQSTYYLTSPWDAPVSGAMPNLRMNIGGVDYFTDSNGNVVIPEVGPLSANIFLEGPWAKVYAGSVTPSFSATLQEGGNTISFDGNSNIKERTAYRSVQDVHDHMKLWMPNFTGMDFQLPTNIDVTGGDCNAFYDGSSINFYDLANGCNATSNIPDIAYHEYGHGINDNYYQSQGGTFFNGAIGEAYADFWAISLTNNPILGSGFYVDNQDPIRRYDVDPKVYPMDLVGEVHQDGEILMGAWWDTHLLMGSDWNITIPLFVEAYAGLQAQTMNGNEGQAYTDVLIDLLLADDDDGDITNGTPNGNAIVQGFYIHGITLISNATFVHAAELYRDSGTEVVIESGLDLTFPYLNYLQTVKLHYQVNNGNWTETEMFDQGGMQYFASLGQFANATVIKYYMTAQDINGSIGTAHPFGAHLSLYPNLPDVTIVGVSQMALQDCDNNENWGAWNLGVNGDNATTGIWDLVQPISSLTVDAAPGTIVQTGTQTTPNGEYCFVTGNALPNDGIGANDVDGGRTTLQSPAIDMSGYAHPIIAYNRWYTNSPPGGANPGADWFQVQMSNDNGASWVYIENTSTSDMSWRTNAFRVEDYLQPSAQMKFRFIASDSIRLDVNLTGGSLVEAAMDDFILFDEFDPNISVNEKNSDVELVFPNPGNDYLVIQGNSELGMIQIWDATGRLVYKREVKSKIDNVKTDSWIPGVYQIRLSNSRSYRWIKG